MKRGLLLFILGTLALPLLAAAQNVQLVTVSSPTQPNNGTALPNTTVAAVAIVLTAGNSPLTITNLSVQRVGSAADSAVVGLDVRDSATNVIATVGGSATPFNSSHTATIPLSVSLAAGEKKTLLVSAKVASNLSPYQGQFFELNISGVGTGAVLSGSLPIFGAQYSLTSGVNKPTCILSSNSGTYTVGQTVTLSWSSSNATGGTITGLGSVNTNGSQGILPTGSSATYTATFTGPGGTGTCNVTLTRSAASGGVFHPGTVAPPGTVPVSNGGGTVTTPSGTAPITPDPRTAPGTGGTSGVGDVCTGLNCTLCDLAKLVQNIINWILGFSIPLAAAMFAWAGILYFTSATNPNNIARAHTIFLRVLIGVIFIVGSWLIFQTVLYVFLSPEQYTSWNKLECVSDRFRPTAEKANKLFDALPVSSGVTSVDTDPSRTTDPETGAYVSNPAAGPGGTCPSGYEYAQDPAQGASSASCENSDGKVVDVVPPGTSSPQSDAQARQAFTANGIGVTSTGNCSDQSVKTCTSLVGVQQSTITGVEQLQQNCGCRITVTGGTEVGHSDTGTYTHASGYKLDLDPTSQLTSQITSWTSIGARPSDNAPQYQRGNTTCARESSHWDCTFIP